MFVSVCAVFSFRCRFVIGTAYKKKHTHKEFVTGTMAQGNESCSDTAHGLRDSDKINCNVFFKFYLFSFSLSGMYAVVKRKWCVHVQPQNVYVAQMMRSCAFHTFLHIHNILMCTLWFWLFPNANNNQCVTY